MKLVIDIDEMVYKFIKETPQTINRHLGKTMMLVHLMEVINQGTPLPKGHGRLIDADKTLEVAWQDFYKHEEEWEEKDENYLPLHRFYDQNGFECCHQTIVNAPTIIEADKEAKDAESNN